MNALASLLAPADLDTARTRISGADPALPTRFRIGEAAAAVLGAVGTAAAAIYEERGGESSDVAVDVVAAAASLRSFLVLSLDGESPLANRPPSPTTSLYPARDGWIHLHGGFPALRDGTLRVLECDDTAEAIAKAVGKWDAQALEDRLADEALCGARVRSTDEWRPHPQSRALASVPVVEVKRFGASDPEPFRPAARPLSGIRVLDLTRVLAGPTCARTLAEHGADVLHVRGPTLPSIEPFVMDTNHGKRSTFLDLSSPSGVERLRELARSCDVFSQGYRGGALERRGLGPEALAEQRPGIVYVSINCYGHDGPWRTRPGWEQLAQSATGIALEQGGGERPQLLPAAATDYTTGYLAAFGALQALRRRAREGGSYHVRVSLARTAMWIESLGRVASETELPAGPDLDALAPLLLESDTEWGRLRHLGPTVEISSAPPHWERPVVPLGTHAATWNEAGA